MREDLRAELVVDGISMAVACRRPEPGLIHHSDRGSQYGSLTSAAPWLTWGILASTGRRGDAYDNSACESVISTLKFELVRGRSSPTRDAARLAVFDYIETFYNTYRLTSASRLVSHSRRLVVTRRYLAACHRSALMRGTEIIGSSGVSSTHLPHVWRFP
jgi:transposase InsO family protein